MRAKKKKSINKTRILGIINGTKDNPNRPLAKFKRKANKPTRREKMHRNKMNNKKREVITNAENVKK